MRVHAASALAAALVVSGMLAACAEYPLHANMVDTEFNAVLDQNFRTGMTFTEVDAQLDQLRVSRDDRRLYETTPAQLLARVYQPGGRWLDDDDDMIRWVDTWFVFTGGTMEPGALTRWYTRRGAQRYFHGEPVYPPPASETAYPTRRYPFSPPPPAKPPEAP
ncbi:MAG: hypothetical protein H7Y88_03205 [Phycisphaerales bacterium]|nr:hypothetical protein [Phycisphaerales bacterium]